MEHFETLLYIVFVVGSIIYSIYKSGKKKQAPNGVNEQEPRPEDHKPQNIQTEYIADDFDTIFSDTQADDEIPTFNFEEPEEKEKKPEKHMTILEKHETKRAEATKHKTSEREKKNTEKTRPNTTFNLKDAVIYSEILKRKY